MNVSLLNLNTSSPLTPMTNPLTAELSDKLLIGFYFFCCLLGFPLNLLTLLRVIRRYQTFPHRQIFLIHLNLNLSDLMVLSFPCLGRMIWLYTYQWTWGWMSCRLMRFLEAFALTFSSNIIVCVALERALAVHSPFQTYSGVSQRVRLMLIFAWILGIATSLPQLWVWRLYEPFPHWFQCVSVWDIVIFQQVMGKKSMKELVHPLSGNHSIAELVRLLPRKTYNIYHLLVTFWIPLILIVVFYGVVQRQLRRNLSNSRVSRRRRSSSSTFICDHTAARNHLGRVSGSRRIQQNVNRTLRITITLVLVYILLWLPYNTLSWWSIVDLDSYRKAETMLQPLHDLVVLNSVINPFIYGSFSSRGLLLFCRKIFRCPPSFRSRRNA